MPPSAPHTFLLPDLSCGHCVRAVTAALQTLDPQAQVQADPATKQVRVLSTQPAAALAEALRAAGYPPQSAPQGG